jgi:hypothetical protein
MARHPDLAATIDAEASRRAQENKSFFDVVNDLVCCGHMSGLLVRGYDRWP